MAKLWVKFVLFSACVSLTIAIAVEKPNNTVTQLSEEFGDMPVCHYTDSKMTECIQSAAEKIKKFLARGIPSFGIQPMEPLRVPSVRLRQPNPSGKQFKFDAWLSDVTVKGLTDYSFNNLNILPEQLKVTANISLPHLHLTGEFMLLGQFQMLPIESSGKITANFTMCTALIEAEGAIVHKRVVVKDAVVHLTCAGPMQADLSDEHSGTVEMGNVIFHLIEMITDHITKMHSNEAVKEVQPAVELTLASFVEEVANKILKHIPYEMLFPN